MLQITLRRLLIVWVLGAASVSLASAQDAINSQKRAAIKTLIEVIGVQRHTAATFEESVTQHQKNWPVAVIADFKAKGLFKRLSPEDATKMEKLINDFSDNIFNEIKRRVVQEVFTSENLAASIAPVFDKYLTEDEINEIIAFCQTPTGKRLINEYSKVLTEAVNSHLRARGAFDVNSSPEVEKAKMESLKKEVEANPLKAMQQILTTAKIISADRFSETEIRELTAFSRNPLGKKLAEISPSMTVEIFVNTTTLYAPRVEKLTEEVITEQMEFFQQRTYEILKKATPSAGRPSGN